MESQAAAGNSRPGSKEPKLTISEKQVERNLSGGQYSGNHCEMTKTWNRSCKEGLKREEELFTKVEAAVVDEKRTKKDQSGNCWCCCCKKKKRGRGRSKTLDRGDFRNLDEAQKRRYEVERRVDVEIRDFLEASDEEEACPQLILAKLWQMMQSRDTKNLNLDKDFDEITRKMKQTGWTDATRTRRFWMQNDDEDQ